MANQISIFYGRYRFLSNFFGHPVEYEDILYPSSEHAFQAAKTLDIADRKRIAGLRTPGKAKRAGKKVKLRNGWDDAKDNIMYEIVKIKFSDPFLKQMLLDTGDAELIEGNTWNDTYWGVCRGVGRNQLGKILMRIRKELQKN